jgi:phage host-nuclease inhibitor protein Gam
MGLAAVRHRGEQGGIKSIEDLDEAIKLIGLYDIELERVNHKLEVEITRLKTEALVEAAETSQMRTEWLAMAETYIHAKRDEVLKGKKSAALNFGKVGFRKSPSKLDLPPKGTDEMETLAARIVELKSSGQSAFAEVAVRSQNYVLKADISKLNDDSLALIELERAPGKDVFFVEPDREKVREVSNG